MLDVILGTPPHINYNGQTRKSQGYRTLMRQCGGE